MVGSWPTIVGPGQPHNPVDINAVGPGQPHNPVGLP